MPQVLDKSRHPKIQQFQKLLRSSLKTLARAKCPPLQAGVGRSPSPLEFAWKASRFCLCESWIHRRLPPAAESWSRLLDRTVAICGAPASVLAGNRVGFLGGVLAIPQPPAFVLAGFGLQRKNTGQQRMSWMSRGCRRLDAALQPLLPIRASCVMVVLDPFVALSRSFAMTSNGGNPDCRAPIMIDSSVTWVMGVCTLFLFL